MLKTTINHTDVVVSAILSSRLVDWGHLREIERIREEIYIDPSHIADSLSELERRLSPVALKTLTDVSQSLLRQYHKGDRHITYSITLLKQSLWELPYFERPPLLSECRTLEYMVFTAFPWMLYLMVTDPAL
jgi:hypothetical protein